METKGERETERQKGEREQILKQQEKFPKSHEALSSPKCLIKIRRM